MSEKAEGILSKAVELWPMLQRPFARDPVADAIETDGFRGKKISDLYLPYWNSNRLSDLSRINISNKKRDSFKGSKH